MPSAEPSPDATVYGLAPSVVARLTGLALVALALLVFLGTAAVALLGLSPDLLVAGVALLGLAVAALAWWLRRAWVLRCTDRGYRVRLVRGAGTTEGRWKDVEDAVTTHRPSLGQQVPCLVLRLRDGRTTTIPVGVLAVDNDQLVRELQSRLQRGSGLRPA